MKKGINLSIVISVHGVNNKLKYAGGASLIIPIFIDKKDYSRKTLIYIFEEAAIKLANKLKI